MVGVGNNFSVTSGALDHGVFRTCTTQNGTMEVSAATSAQCTASMAGRYVALWMTEIPRNSPKLSLCEVEVYGEIAGKSLALSHCTLSLLEFLMYLIFIFHLFVQ